jgi:hypothetical protein
MKSHAHMFCDIHIAPKSSAIYILIPKLPSLIPPTMSLFKHHTILYLANFSPYTITDSRVRSFSGSQKYQIIFFSHSSLPPSRPSKYTFIIILMLITYQTWFKRIFINKRKYRGDIILKTLKQDIRRIILFPSSINFKHNLEQGNVLFNL